MTSKEKVVLWLADIELFYWEEGKTENDLYQSEMAHKAIELLKSQPDVVMCKDCMYYDGYVCKHEVNVRSRKPDWYCADAWKRKEQT